MKSGSIDFKLKMGLLGAVTIQLCTGSTYAWSTFIQPLQQDCNISPVDSQWVFAIRTAVFAISMIWAGKLLDRYGLKRVALGSALLFSLGHIIPILSPSSFILLLTGMGILAGLGISGGYLAALRFCATAIPDKKGLIIGIGAGAFGGGAILASYVSHHLLVQGFNVSYVLAGMGLVYGLGCAVSACFLPDQVEVARTQKSECNFETSGISNSRLFAACFSAKLANNFGGLLVIGNMSILAVALGHSASYGLLGITAFSTGNATGRILWGAAYDRFGSKTIVTALIGLSLVLLSYGFIGHIGICFLALTFAAGFFFGAGFVHYASYLVDQRGELAIQRLYPLVFSAHGLGAIIGPPLGAMFIDLGWVLSIFPVASLVVFAGALLFSSLTFPVSYPNNTCFTGYENELKNSVT